MVRALQRVLSPLLALVLIAATGWQVVYLTQPGGDAAVSKPACKCCAADPATCSTPSCCSRPADGRAPAAPAVPRCAFGNEWQAITSASLTIFTLLRPAPHDLFFRQPLCEAGAVPIFQRYCSFLI